MDIIVSFVKYFFFSFTCDKLKENFIYKVKIKFRKYNFFLPFTIVT